MAYSFTAGGNPDGPGEPGGGDHGEVWNPTGGPNGTGAWEQPGPGAAGGAQLPQYQFSSGSWGGRGNDIDKDGNEVAGTSGAARDADRYRQMGQKPVYGSGPQIDQSQSGESRGISMGALGLLGQTAAGTSPSAAEKLGTSMGYRAQAAQHSLGASVRGGAMARAAAGRGATMNASVIDAQTRQANAATRAGEMAGAREGYLKAATGQRGQDLGAATSQAGLDMGQRGANDSRENFYEGLGQDTKNAELGHQLGRTAADQNAAAAAGAQSTAEHAASQAQTDRVVNGVVGGVTGGIQAYGRAQKPDPDPYTTSDPKAKTKVRPVSDARARELKATGEGMIAGYRANLGNGPSAGTGDKAHGGYDEADVEAIRRPNIDREDPYPKSAPRIDHENPYAHHSLFGEAPENYARSRKDKPGYMFGGAPEASYGNLRDDREPMAPGTDDFAHGEGRRLAGKDRDIAMSDPQAKQEARELGMREGFKDGMNHTQMMHDSGEVQEAPAYMSAENKKPSVSHAQPPTASRKAAASGASRVDPARQNHANKVSEENYDKASQASILGGALGYGGTMGALYADKSEDAYQRSRMQHPPTDEQPVAPPAAEGPGAWQQLATRAKAMMPSDEKTKRDIHDEGPMAAANRSMAPSSYEYKPEFTPEDQEPGEKNIGPMANKMKADPVAGTAIVTSPENGLLAIDKTKGLKLVMGGLASLQKQVDRMGGHRA